MGTPFIIKGYDFNYIFALPYVSFLTTVVSNIITTNVHIFVLRTKSMTMISLSPQKET